jgi:hypothetical protein
MFKREVMFVLSIDTEEEWNWEAEFPEHNFSVNNVQFLPAFQSFCESLAIRPTYFIDYPVVDDAQALNQVKTTIKSGKCEVGGHLHPWCNPPYFGKTTEFESHVVNLPVAQVEAKLDRLTNKIQRTLGVTTRSFRTGRWGINSDIMQLLKSRGFKVDSSVYPLYHNKHFSCMDAPLTPYWPDINAPNTLGIQRDIMELPVTVGFNRENFDFWRYISRQLEQAPFTYLRATGLLWQTNIMRKIYLSPELSNVSDMQSLVDKCIDRGDPVIHMYLHSSSLLDGVTGFYAQEQAFKAMCDAIQAVVQHMQVKVDVTFATISECAAILTQRDHLVKTAKPIALGDQKIA